MVNPARLIASLTTAALGSAALVSATLPVAHAGDMGDCPATVIVAARGNDASETVNPVRYSEESDAVSNGWEGLNIRAFLQYAEQRHLDQHGESLLRDIPVLGLSGEYHPADIPIPEITDGAGLIDVLPRAGEVITSTVDGFRRTIDVGIPGARLAIEDYEAATGCSPRYILIGYSLGASMLSLQEDWLAQKGQLGGTFYFGAGHQSPGDPAAVGATVNGGILGRLPSNSLDTARTPNRMIYCIPHDFACDFTPTAVQVGLDEGTQGPHARYFLHPDTEPHSAEVADRFSSWLG